MVNSSRRRILFSPGCRRRRQRSDGRRALPLAAQDKRWSGCAIKFQARDDPQPRSGHARTGHRVGGSWPREAEGRRPGHQLRAGRHERTTGLALELRVGQIVDVQWYDYIDFWSQTTPAIAAQAKAMVASGARAKAFGQRAADQADGAVRHGVKTDLTLSTIDIVNPASGEVLQTPQIRTEAGQAALGR